MKKYICGRDSATDVTGELTALPRPPSWIEGKETSKEGKGEGKDGYGGEREVKPLGAKSRSSLPAHRVLHLC